MIMYHFTFVNSKQFGLLLEAIHLRSFCGEFLISGDDKLRSFLPVSYRALSCLGQNLRMWLEGSRLAASRKVSIRPRSFCGESLYLGPRSEMLAIKQSHLWRDGGILLVLKYWIFSRMLHSSSIVGLVASFFLLSSGEWDMLLEK